jgi:DNA-3-methyladenine glycosylase I
VGPTAASTTTDDRCPWARTPGPEQDYHDAEWGVPSHDDRYLFELLVLEGAQAGLSWSTVLAKREHYRAVLDGFDPERVVGYDEDRLEALLVDPGIVRNRLKIYGTVRNARAFLDVRDGFGSFASYLWDWVDGRPVVTRRPADVGLPATSELSERLSKDLKRRGFTFVGPTIVHAYLQAVGVVDDHVAGCPAARD